MFIEQVRDNGVLSTDTSPGSTPLPIRFRGGHFEKRDLIYLSSPGSTIPSIYLSSPGSTIPLPKGENSRCLRISPPWEGGAGGG